MQISDLVGQYHQTTTSGTDKLTGTKGVENLVASLRSLTKGNIFEGTVSSMKNGRVTLALSNGQQLSARMEGKVPLSVGQSMFFQVKSNDGTQIAIRPFVVDGNGVNYTLMTALNVAGLAVDADHLSMVNRMMQEQMPIDRNSLQQMARLVSANPDIDVQTAWTNSFVDTQLAQEAAKAMIENGADVIKHCANACGNGAMSAAVDANIWCQGDSYDQSSLAPNNILDSAIYNLDVVLDKAIESVVEGSFSGDVYNLGMADGAVEVLLSDNLPDDVKATAEQAIEQIKSGEVEVVRDYTLRD